MKWLLDLVAAFGSEGKVCILSSTPSRVSRSKIEILPTYRSCDRKKVCESYENREPDPQCLEIDLLYRYRNASFDSF